MAQKLVKNVLIKNLLLKDFKFRAVLGLFCRNIYISKKLQRKDESPLTDGNFQGAGFDLTLFFVFLNLIVNKPIFELYAFHKHPFIFL